MKLNYLRHRQEVFESGDNSIFGFPKAPKWHLTLDCLVDLFRFFSSGGKLSRGVRSRDVRSRGVAHVLLSSDMTRMSDV